MTWLDGPTMRDDVRYACRKVLVHPADGVVVKYRYITAHGKRAPEYAATHLMLQVFSLKLGHPLQPFIDVMAAMPGFVRAEQLTNHPTLRPMVIATFDRRPTT